ncbi:threonine--tRNA ligase [Venenivibrio stagnispumantis]|uniref:Threonine--tRNA ligase n=1 Tax=Venenivibrio stagnispumantis TaxID=407998 RepID=A0AA45WP77_9AQUI|nr:threonine--tRNA ligase [Venenivibrio stagnispumantis]MCW4573374.1 threonine--tRNA ligase [Venenivibrio stagnispumantis]SMP20870.1 threonyl-tRNA synthetase [Venenivibrio stagnispumantis]
MAELIYKDKKYTINIGERLKDIIQKEGLKDIIGAVYDNQIIDIHTPIKTDGVLKAITKKDKESLEILRHSLAHIMAQALKRLYGNEKVHLGIGPTTEVGFYYDVEIEGKRITEEDLPVIEEEMKKIIKENLQVEREEIKREEAIKLFEKMREIYKIEIIKHDIPENETISIYKQGEFIDLCRGPHIPSTGLAGAFKLISVAGAYWKGKETNPMLQRIYGVAFWEEKELKQYLNMLEEAKKRDHRKIGKELELFMIDEEVGGGLAIWLPKGAIIRKEIEDDWKKEHIKRGYQLVYTPHVGKETLWQTSGHVNYYRENMFPEMFIEEEGYFVKPMNCPFHVEIYKSKQRSYKELPIKLAELGTVYRYERSGVLHGLMRVRGFTQDDAHIICREDQVEQQIKEVLEFAIDTLKSYGFEEFEVYLSTRPEKSVGDDKMWEIATNSLKKAIESVGLDYKIDEGGGAFYGPKIDVKIKDSIGRMWQCSTIQFDFNLPERFDMYYIGEDNQKHRPYMVHRAIFGSIERFIGVLLEHYAGLLPLWLAPVQVALIPISDAHLDYAKMVKDKLQEEGIRVYLDERNERMNKKIRDAEIQKIPYMAVIGDKELQENAVSLRTKKDGNLGIMKVEDFINLLKEKIKSKQ